MHSSDEHFLWCRPLDAGQQWGHARASGSQGPVEWVLPGVRRGGGATNVDFNLQGSTWSWGDFRLDQAVAKGSCHSEEGVQIEELCLRAGTVG